MCGDHVLRNTIGGGLAVLGPCLSETDTSLLPLSPLSGRLFFHDQGKGGSMATHAMFTMNPSAEPHSSNLAEPCLVKIHETGDLTSSATASPIWASFSLKPAASAPGDEENQPIVVELERPVKIEVGVDGIIGRRVSLWTHRGMGPVAEGIIGYN
ncbi:hypothetical protein GGR50DRAFT_690198 [Xylaria sp. CBS 124048]|nr:hypothetical protein GGR50DRAFT_690198 [Xylaria sp. CBS 124048]